MRQQKGGEKRLKILLWKGDEKRNLQGIQQCFNYNAMWRVLHITLQNP